MEGLLTDFKSILEDSSSSDLTLVCQDGEVKAHRIILSGRSPVFKSLLKSDMQEKSSGEVNIEDFRIEVVRAMVNYIYTAKIEDTFDDIVNLMKIGNKYLIDTLVEDCSKRLIKLITAYNVLELGAIAEVLLVQDLLKNCAHFVSENLEVLEMDWKEKLVSSPLFLVSIVEVMKSDKGVELPEISRFGLVLHPEVDEMWNCGGNQDAISIQLSHAATLTSIGLFGTENKNSIPVKISVRNSKSVTIFESNTSYKSTGTKVPTRVPVRVKMVAGTKYTIGVVIESANVKTYYGLDGKREVSCGGKLKLSVDNSSDSTNGTRVDQGQIPSLGFKI